MSKSSYNFLTEVYTQTGSKNLHFKIIKNQGFNGMKSKPTYFLEDIILELGKKIKAKVKRLNERRDRKSFDNGTRSNKIKKVR